MDIRLKIQTSTNQFFLRLKTTGKDLYGGDPKKYLRSSHWAGPLTKIVLNLCSKLGVRGDGAHEIVTTHDLRATMASLLIDAGYDDAIITLRSVHRDAKSLRNYHPLRGNIGANQIRRMFGDGPLSDCNGRYQFKNGLYEEHNVSNKEFVLYGSDGVLADLSTTPEKPDVPKVIQKTVQKSLQFDDLPTSTLKEIGKPVDDCKSGTRMRRNSMEKC